MTGGFWYTARSYTGKRLGRVEVFPPQYYGGNSVLSADSLILIGNYLGLDASNAHTFRLDMGREVIWFNGREAVFLTAEPVPKDPVPEGCPKCGHRGRFIRTALVCPTHGVFAGF